MSAQPNLLGYAVLAAFAGAAVYAVTRKAQAATPCVPVTAARVSHFNVALDTAVVWFDKEQNPPPAVVTGDRRIQFPGLPMQTFAQPLIVITAGDVFWRYEGSPGESIEGKSAPDAKDAFCALG